VIAVQQQGVGSRLISEFLGLPGKRVDAIVDPIVDPKASYARPWSMAVRGM
jgi:hypothetical protein